MQNVDHNFELEQAEVEAKRWRSFKLLAIFPVSVGMIVSFASVVVLDMIQHLLGTSILVPRNVESVALAASTLSALACAFLGITMIRKGMRMTDAQSREEKQRLDVWRQ